MKLFAITVVLAINVALAQENSDGYTYEINAQRVGQTIAPGNPCIYMYYQVLPKQNVTFFQSIGPEQPFRLECYLTCNDKEVFLNDQEHALNSCDTFDDGTWEYVITEIFKKGMIPDGTCSVDKDSYIIDATVAPVTVTFPKKIECGNYDLIFNMFVNNDWAAQIEMVFTIVDNPNCFTS